MRRHVLWSAMLAAGLLAACGGGGSGAGEGSSATEVTLSGTAAKGLMARATVTAHAVKADGTVDETALDTDETDDNGAYSLSFEATQDQPVVIRVTAKADTTHLDEVTGLPQSLPVGFSMRSVIVPASSGRVTTSASITPFSEMAVAAASKAAGGITATNTEQAVSAVSQLLGFDPVKVAVAKVGEAVSPEQKQMTVMLAAVSQLAASDALGCDTGDAGAKVDCVVGKLAGAATTDSMKLTGDAGVDVSGALGTAVDAVLADTALATQIGVEAADLAIIKQNLACTTSCDVAPVTEASTAIAAAKSLLSQIRTDIASVFLGSGTDIGTGPLNAQATAFEAAMKDVKVPAEVLVADLSALIKGADLYNDFQAGRSGNSRGHGSGMVGTSTPSTIGSFTAVGCTVYVDGTLSAAATVPASTNVVGCRGTVYANVASGVRTSWRHSFNLTPQGEGKFGYSSWGQRRTETWNGSVWQMTGNQTLSGERQGTLTAGTDTNGHIISFAVTGELPAAFVADGTDMLANDHHTWDLSGTRTIAGFKEEVSSLSGTLVAYKDATTVEGTLKITSLETREIPLTAEMTQPTASNPATQGAIAEVEMDIDWTTAAAEFAGTFKAIDSKWDKSATYHVPTNLSLSGSLRNIVQGKAVEFMAGTFTAKATGYENFDDTQSTSATNYHGLDLSFVGSVTAPNRPKLEVTVGASGKSYADELDTLTMQYRTIVDGTPRTVVALSHSVVDGKDVFKLTEAAANLSLAWTQGAQTADLKRGDLVIGTFDQNAKNVTFSDKTHVSLDLGF